MGQRSEYLNTLTVRKYFVAASFVRSRSYKFGGQKLGLGSGGFHDCVRGAGT